MKRLAVGVAFGALLCGGVAAAQGSSFTDVDEGRFFTESVEWALENEITFGVGDGTRFAPDDPVTRGRGIRRNPFGLAWCGCWWGGVVVDHTDLEVCSRTRAHVFSFAGGRACHWAEVGD